MNLLQIQEHVLMFAMIFLSATILFCLLRAILGPRFTDRLLGINVINVKVIVLICIMAVFFDKSYLIDISLVYSAISFLSVIVLAKIFLSKHLSDSKGGGRRWN